MKNVHTTFSLGGPHYIYDDGCIPHEKSVYDIYELNVRHRSVDIVLPDLPCSSLLLRPQGSESPAVSSAELCIRV